MIKKTSSRKSKIFLACILILTIALSSNVFASTLAPGSSDGAEFGPTPTPSSAPVMVTDPSTGVTVNLPAGALPAGVTSISLGVTKEDTRVVELAQGVVSDDIKVNSILNLSLLDQNGSLITSYNGSIEVTIPVTDDSNGVICANIVDGTYEILPSKVQNGFITFKAPNLNFYYALVKIDSASIPTVPGEGAGSDTSSDGGETTPPGRNPQTADNVVLFVILAGFACIAVGTSLFVIKRKKV